MSWIKGNGPFIILILSALWVMILSIYDILFNKAWTNTIIAAYALIIILFFILLFLRFSKTMIIEETIEEFEKTLKGGLFHFKCPSCCGIFAIKKSRSNDKKPFNLTCPDCGLIGHIPSEPQVVEEEIPEKKSMGVNFKCKNCGEGVTIWAEGQELYQELNVLNCPFCGLNNAMEKF